MEETAAEETAAIETSAFERMLAAAPETLCLYPFTHVNFKLHGKVASCFRTRVATDSSTETDLWNNTTFNSLRQDLASGRKPAGCESCWRLEENGGFSYRQETIRDKVVHSRWRDVLEAYDPQTGEMREGPRQLELRLSHHCGLTCRVCCPEYSSKWGQLVEKQPELIPFERKPKPQAAPIHNQRLFEFLQKHKGSLRYVMFSGGEPLLQKEHYTALKMLAPFEGHITLEYTTNLNTLQDRHESVLEYWPKFRSVRLKVSVDADREIYPFVRTGGSIERVEENLRTLQARFPTEHRREPDTGFPDDKLIFIGTCTVSVYNIFRLPEIANYFTNLGLIFHTSQVQMPDFQSTQVLPPPIKTLVTRKLEAYLANMDRELEETLVASGQKLWTHERSRITQHFRVRRYVANSLAYMNSADRSSEWDRLLQFESLFARATGAPTLLDIYPEFRDV